MRNLKYSEGVAFTVPLRTSGYARGVVARMAPEGKILFGYFFGPRLETEEEATLNRLKPRNAILRVMFGDLGLIKGDWKIIGKLAGWNRSEWKMPDFARRDPLGKRKTRLVRYSDDNPTVIELEQTLAVDDPELQPDRLSGAGAVEKRLTKLLM